MAHTLAHMYAHTQKKQRDWHKRMSTLFSSIQSVEEEEGLEIGVSLLTNRQNKVDEIDQMFEKIIKCSID